MSNSQPLSFPCDLSRISVSLREATDTNAIGEGTSPHWQDLDGLGMLRFGRRDLKEVNMICQHFLVLVKVSIGPKKVKVVRDSTEQT
jgi:hypothetical protein